MISNETLMLQLRAQNLLVRYADLIDSDKLEEWLTLFTDDCEYLVITRENVSQGLVAPLIWCDNHKMLADRVASYREVNEYNLHYDRHVLGPVLLRSVEPDAVICACSYVLLQTTLEGVTSVFSAGVMETVLVQTEDELLIKKMKVIPDTAQIPTLLATPI